MGAPEAKIEGYLRKRVKETGGMIRKIRWIGRRGAADNLVFYKFPAVALVECKAAGKDVDPRSQQARDLRRMREAGWPVYVVSSREEVDEVLARLAVKMLTLR